MTGDSKYALTWDLDSLLPRPESEEFRGLFDQFRGDLSNLADRSDALPAPDPASARAWSEFLGDYQSLAARATELNAFIGCHAAADAGNRLYRKFEAELSALDPLRERVATNVEFALRETTDEAFAAFVAADRRLAELAFYLADSRQNAMLRLPREQESLAAELAVDGLHAWGRSYDRVSGDVRVRVMEKGEIVEKSVGQVTWDSPERTVRQNNFYAADKAWSTVADHCAEAINHIAGVRLTRYRRLGLRDHLEAPLRHNRMRRETLETMWSVVAERRPRIVDYLNRKAKLLGLEKLAWYDVTAPLPIAGTVGCAHQSSSSDDTNSEGRSAETGDGGHSPPYLSWDAACDTVVDTLGEFGQELGEFAAAAIRERWVEAEDRPGKRQGGFCTGFPVKRQSRIFMTFTGSPNSMSTLAHELGHAWHAHVLRDRPLFLQDYPMNLAETASTFAEAVVNERRLADADSTAAKLAILDEMLGDAVVFLMNIHARFAFEDAFHRERSAGELSAERLSELMLAAQRETYCDALAADGWNPRFWASKLHFYISTLPFYNFPYTFGYLLSQGLSTLAAEQRSAFPERYRNLLIATGCMETEDAIRSTLGVDASTPDFWHKSLDLIGERVGRFLELSAP
ncbi:MAG: M3 family oligoendopeptidase [Planctomycetales bacterium]